MKNNRIYIAGIFLALGLIAAGGMMTRNIPAGVSEGVATAVMMLGTAVGSVSYVRLTFNRLMNGKEGEDFRREVFDERNVMIKEKAGHVMNSATLVLLGVAVLIFIVLDYTVPAIIIGVIIFLHPLLLIFISERIAKHY